MPIPLTADYDAVRLRAAARGSKDTNQTRRLLTLAAIYDGVTRTQAAGIGGVTVQIVRDRVVKLNTPACCMEVASGLVGWADGRSLPLT